MKIMTRKAIKRREFLKMASCLMAVPIGGFSGLARADLIGQKPLRILTLPETYGLDIDKRSSTFVRSSAGNYTLQASDLGTTLAPLAGYVDNLAIVSNLTHSVSLVAGGNGHGNVNGHVLCGSRAYNGSKSTLTQQHSSLDIAIADYLEGSGYLPSNRLYSHLYFSNSAARDSQTICYDNSGVQVRSIAGVSSIMDTVIGTLGTGDGIDKAHIAAQQDVLDLVAANVSTLKQRLANSNFNTKLDAFNTGIDEFADQLEERLNLTCEVPTDVSSITDNSTSNIFKLITQAFTCDTVTSLTYKFGSEIVNTMSHYDLQSDDEDTAVNTALRRSFHAVSHNTTDVSDRVHELVRTSYSTEIAKLLDTLSTTQEIYSTDMMIDNTIIFMPSILANNTHETNDPPTFMFAGNNTNINGGQHYDGSGKTINDLLATVGQGMYAPFDSFGGYSRNGYVSACNTGVIDRMLKDVIA